MPLINYLCSNGHTFTKFFRYPKDSLSTFTCENCGQESKKQLCSPNSRSIVVVDNGVQAKSVEVNLELVKDIQDRSTKDFKDK